MLEVVSAGEAAPAGLRGMSAALGNFDGVHRGHAAVMAAAAAAGRLAAAVFSPHPRRFFAPQADPFHLQSPAQRDRALAALGVEALFEIPFTGETAALTDEAFCREFLRERMGLTHVAVGADFRFGRDRMGDGAALARLGAALGFGVSLVADVAGQTGRISSTAIRAAIAAGDMGAAAENLGRPWAIEGVVGPGAQRGRTIGFPTANLALGDYVRPAFGVYAVRADAGDGVWRPGVANCGVKPTLGGDAAPLLEAHLFDFAGDLYGRRLEVQLIAHLRPERRFDSFEALKAQIAEDAAQARGMLFLGD